MLVSVVTETYDSPRMRKLNHHYRNHRYSGMAGIRAVCLRLFDEGLTYERIAKQISTETKVEITVRALGHYLTRWRRERTEDTE